MPIMLGMSILVSSHNLPHKSDENINIADDFSTTNTAFVRVSQSL